MIIYQGRSYEHEPGDTVLTCLERNGVDIPSFCRSGVCQSCLLKVTEGSPPPKARAGLKESWQRQGLVMSCVCEINEPLTLESSDATRTYPSRVLDVRPLSTNVVGLSVEKPDGFAFEGGQFVQLASPELGVSRPYSIASLPSDDRLEFHVAVYAEGALSPWLASSRGKPLQVTGPFGDCTYVPDDAERPLLLAGTGTGLAPLAAVLRAAVRADHRGPIHMYHGARSAEDLYCPQELRALMSHPNVTVERVFLEGQSDEPGVCQGDLLQRVLLAHPKPADYRIYLCGSPALVQASKKRLYLAGASLSRIHSDPFVSKGPRTPTPP